jgi:hypothetical protein
VFDVDHVHGSVIAFLNALVPEYFERPGQSERNRVSFAESLADFATLIRVSNQTLEPQRKFHREGAILAVGRGGQIAMLKRLQ